jgi:AbrB family looped-hinge helix DNA binding protein
MSAGTTQNIPTIPLATVVTRKGQVTIPAPIRDALDIKQGDTITFHVEGNVVTLKPAHSTLAEGYQSIPALKKPLTEQEIEEIVRDDTAEAYAKKVLR